MDYLLLLVSLIAGVAGSVALVDAVREYRDTVRAYAQVEVAHEPASVVWHDSATRPTLELTIVIANDSPVRVTAEYLDLRLYAEGEFAGADYDDWQPVTIASLASERRDVSLEISNSELEDDIGRADLSLRGEVRLRFDGVERPLTQRISIVLGRVAPVTE